MQLGSFTVEILSEGRFEFLGDGHINRSSGDESHSNQNTDLTGTAATIVAGVNPILIKTGPHNVLLDAGLGWGLDTGSEYKDVSNVETNLEIFGLDREDITHVILTHLHYDHSAGCSFTNADFKTEATFPNATYFVHQKEWEFALSQVENKHNRLGAGYNLDDFYHLIANQKIELLSGNSNTILKGITAACTGGHTPGHQAVIISNNGKSAYYLGDLLPTSKHLNHYAMRDFDTNPIQAKKRKVQLLRSAYEQKACLFFYHSQHSRMGSLHKNKNKQYVLKELKRS